MAKILLFLIWPVGLAIIFGVAALLARRAQAAPHRTGLDPQRRAHKQPVHP